MNALKPDSDTITVLRQPFKGTREHIKKRYIFENYKLRAWTAKSFMLNTEELATLWHFPISVVEAPRLRRLEAVKGEPPANLPIG